jgi:hypothetical protein
VNKDRFDLEIGKQLRAHQANVPMGSWNVIQARLQVQGAAGNSGSFGFGVALTVGVGLLLGLAAYSALDSEPANMQSDVTHENIVVATISEAPEIKVVDEGVEIAEIEEVAEPEVQKDVDNKLFSGLEEPIASSHAEVSTINTKRSDAVSAPETNPTLAASEVKPVSVLTPSSKIVEGVKQIQTGELPDEITSMEAPFTAAIRTSGSFGYAPFTVDFETVGNPAGQVWDFGPYGKSTDSRPTVVFDKPGLYSVMLSAYRGANEQKIEFVTIEVEEGSSLYMPNSFSPDGDGQNDVFIAKGTKLQSYQMTIVNSKGAVVFQTLDIDLPWAFDHALHGQDGEFYIAIVRAKGVDGKEYNLRQRLNIIY